ncbi:MAG: hypothetical protein OXU84_09590, partial [Cyanobacteria bacterium MAG STY4_bin_9]|nr:hypothetical protein [Cyanobacteria bacterium MAG STY4_bin_9]
EVGLVLQGRAEVAHGHGNGVSQRIGVTTLAVASSLFRVFASCSTTQTHLFLNCFSAVRSICQPDQRRHSISAAVRH